MIRYKCVLNALGKILLIVATAILLPLFWSLSEPQTDTQCFILTFIIYAVSGGLLVFFAKDNNSIRAKEGFLIVTLSWIMVSLIGALPYYFNGIFIDYSSAFFETMSGFTTTGATALANIETQSAAILLWRSMTQWLGGLGVVVLFVAILSQVDTGGLAMLRAELSGPFNEKVSSKVQDSAIILWLIYTALTAILFFLLLFGGMNVTDALCHAFSTISTGGFSTRDLSVAYFGSAYIEWVITIFMFIGGISFPLIYKTMTSKTPKTLLRNEEFRLYLIFTLILIAIVAVDLFRNLGTSPGTELRLAAFQVVSQLTTCGFSTANYSLWPTTSLMICVCLMMIGASYSSTSGSLKIGTYLLSYKSLKSQFFRMLHPRALTDIRINGKIVSDKTVMKVLQLASLFFVLTFVGAIFLSFTGLPFIESLTGAMATISNNGPGMGSIGPAGSYADVSAAGKWILSLLMLLGRLEIYTVLIIFVPAFWRR